MKYKLGDVVVSRTGIGVITSITEMDEKYDINTNTCSKGKTIYYTLGGNKTNNVEESQIIGKLEVIK